MSHTTTAPDFRNCRPACAACCEVISISSPIPGMPNGKPAGVRCIHLTDELLCAIFTHPDRPEVCDQFRFDPLVCGSTREEAVQVLSALEK